MQTLLAIETSTERCSVALRIGDQVQEKMIEGARRHAESVLVFVDELLNEAGISKTQLDAVAFGRGPGAFTGVRLAVALAQGFAFGLDIPAIPVSTLAATAWNALEAAPVLRAHPILVALDARMGEIYTARYVWREAMLQGIDEESLCKPDAIVVSAQERCVGSGVPAYPCLQTPGSFSILPSARAVAVLADRVNAVCAEEALPVYLRDHVALSIRERLAKGMTVVQGL